MFAPEHLRMTSNKYYEQCVTTDSAAQRTSIIAPAASILDLNGHYVTAFAAKIDTIQTPVVLQTMQGRLLPDGLDAKYLGRDLARPSVAVVASEMARGHPGDRPPSAAEPL